MIKWLVRIGSVVGLLLIAFVGVMVLLGGGRTQVNTQASIELERSASTIYPYLTTGPLLMKWVSGMESFQSSEELRIGRRAQVVMSIGGHRHEVTSEVTAMQPPRPDSTISPGAEATVSGPPSPSTATSISRASMPRSITTT